MLRVVKYFVKSRTQGQSRSFKRHCRVGRVQVPPISIPLKLCVYLVPHLSVKEWRDGDIETGGRDRSRSLKMAPFDTALYDFLLVGHSKYSSILYHFRVMWRWIIVTLKSRLKSLKVIQTGTIWKLGCGFLFAFHSNYGSILHHLWNKARYWLKIVIFSYPLAFEYCHLVSHGKTRVLRLPDGEKTLRI